LIGLVRTLTLIYSLSSLVLLSRIQFNLLGRQAYVASILALAPESGTGAGPGVQQIRLREETGLGDLELQRSFLSFSWWLVHRGWKTIMSRVHSAVEEVFHKYHPPKLFYLTLVSHLKISSPLKPCKLSLVKSVN
jgi:peroxin-3